MNNILLFSRQIIKNSKIFYRITERNISSEGCSVEEKSRKGKEIIIETSSDEFKSLIEEVDMKDVVSENNNPLDYNSILKEGDVNKFLKNPFITSTLYYTDKFLLFN